MRRYLSMEKMSGEVLCFFFFSSRRRHTRLQGDWSSDVCSSDLGAYRSAPLGIQRPLDSMATGVISGAAPYWRVAFPNVWGQNYLSVGTYGIAASVYPAGVSGPTNRFTDLAVDLAYMHSFGSNSFTLDGTWIHEKQTWTAGGAANPTNTLRTFRMDAMYQDRKSVV